MLDADPEPGLRGILRDTFKVVWGSRLVAVITATMLNPLPLLPLVPHMLLQIYSCAMVRSNHSLCAAPLLRHPTTTARIHAFHTAMQLAAMALPGEHGCGRGRRCGSEAHSPAAPCRLAGPPLRQACLARLPLTRPPVAPRCARVPGRRAGGVGQSMFPLLQRSRDVRVAECESFLTCVSFMAGLALPMLVRRRQPPA